MDVMILHIAIAIALSFFIQLHVAEKYTTFIFLETINKTPEKLQDAIINGKTNPTIMSKNHEIYTKLENEDINIVYNLQNDDRARFKILDLVVTYDDMYHVVTGKVEANINGRNQVEHPMLCLYHEGYIMKYT